jgi:streptogramin lyase
MVPALMVVACGSPGSPTSPTPAASGPSALPSPTANAQPEASTPASILPAASLVSLTRQATVPGFYGAVAVLAIGKSVWVLDHSAVSLTRIDPATNRVSVNVNLGPGFASGLGFAGGRIWTFYQTAGKVVAVDPATAKIVLTVPLGQDGDRFAIGDGAGWLLTGGQLARIDATTGNVASFGLDSSCGTDGLAAGGGFAWLASAAGSLCKIDERSGTVVARGSGLGNGAGLAIVGGQPWLSGSDGGLSIVDPTTLAIKVAVPSPAPGTAKGATYSLGLPGGENTVVVGDPDGKGGWLRNVGDTIGQVILSSPARIRLFGLFPHSQLAGGVVSAFGSLWVTNFDGGTVERYALPKP